MRPSSVQPIVSIGLAAYNGERYIAAAIESILAQTFGDFELIITDDVSTDATEDICRDYAARDARVRYHRNERNLGSAPNFNRAFSLASGGGRYFKWAAQDDLIAPDYLERCVAALDGDPEAVLCHSWVGVIDEHGRHVGHFASPLERKDSPDPVERFACAVLRHHMALEFYGVVRADVLRTVSPNGGYPRSDSALVAELALAGRFIEIPEPLFLNRDHPGRFMRVAADDLQAAIAWYDRSQAGRTLSLTWRLYRAYFEMVRRRVASPIERLRCYGHLLRWLGVNWNALRLGMERHSAPSSPGHSCSPCASSAGCSARCCRPGVSGRGPVPGVVIRLRVRSLVDAPRFRAPQAAARTRMSRSHPFDRLTRDRPVALTG